MENSNLPPNFPRPAPSNSNHQISRCLIGPRYNLRTATANSENDWDDFFFGGGGEGGSGLRFSEWCLEVFSEWETLRQNSSSREGSQSVAHRRAAGYLAMANVKCSSRPTGWERGLKTIEEPAQNSTTNLQPLHTQPWAQNPHPHLPGPHPHHTPVKTKGSKAGGGGKFRSQKMWGREAAAAREHRRQEAGSMENCHPVYEQHGVCLCVFNRAGHLQLFWLFMYKKNSNFGIWLRKLFNMSGQEIGYFCSKVGLEVTFWTTPQNRKPQVPSSGLYRIHLESYTLYCIVLLPWWYVLCARLSISFIFCQTWLG